jgi:mannose/cellobiose epimerase-like protein (N-acyl-D-glucosamine 2-epimerase family)
MPEKLNEIREKFSFITLEVLDAIIDRCQDPAYPFIDTKLSVIDGKNIYPPAPDKPYNAKNIIFSWIQGRGLEALAGHARWLEENPTPGNRNRITKIRNILAKVIDKMETCRAANNGRLSFIMDADGKLLELGTDGALLPLENLPPGANFSDLFYSKGLLAAAAYLGRRELVGEAEKYFEKVVRAVRTDAFVTDQQSFDPKNKVSYVKGKQLQGPWMICLDGIAVAAEVCEREKWLDTAREMIEHILERHVNTGQFADLEKYDFWEAVDSSGQPWEENGQVLCDPGHALEFVGLALKCILQMTNDKAETTVFLAKYRQILPPLFKHCYKLGFAPGPGGIIKAFDLRRRAPINTDMPWWSLPETIRAAAELFKFSGDTQALGILKECAEAFFAKYLNPAVHNMAYQTRNAAGKVVDIVPATPDADPGYHTGLSLIDAMKIKI